MSRATITTVSLLAIGAVPTGAVAREPPPPAPPEAAAQPAQAAPQPLAGRASIEVRGGMRTRALRYVYRGQRIVVTSRVEPFVPGQVAELEVVRGGKVVGRKRATIRSARGAGRAVFRFEVARRGRLGLRVRHRATPQQAAFRSAGRRLRSVAFRSGAGARGVRVLLLQRGLRRMGFATPVTGRFDAATRRAVLAFRKTNNLARNGYASARVYRNVFRRRGAFRPRSRRRGYHVEFDWSRQVMALVKNGRAYAVYHASSGKASTPTVFGTFRFYRKEPGTNSLGMLQSNYFIGGYAIHGYHSVPTHPASHGCIRLPIPNAHEIDRRVKLGQRIIIYR
jgi:hypothetical protein